MRRILAIVFVAFSGSAAAEKLALGSMELQSCTKGRERATLVLDIEAPNFQRVQHELRACAEHGVATVTLPALLKKEPEAAPVFWEEFRVCTRYTEWISAELSIQTFCR